MSIKLNRVMHPHEKYNRGVKYTYTDSNGCIWEISKDERVPATYWGHWYIGSIISGECFHTLKEVRKFLSRKESDLCVKRTNTLLDKIKDDEIDITPIILSKYDYMRVIIYWGRDTPTVTYTGYDERNVAVINRQYTKVSMSSICRIMRIPDNKVYIKEANNEFFVIEYVLGEYDV